MTAILQASALLLTCVPAEQRRHRSRSSSAQTWAALAVAALDWAALALAALAFVVAGLVAWFG